MDHMAWMETPLVVEGNPTAWVPLLWSELEGKALHPRPPHCPPRHAIILGWLCCHRTRPSLCTLGCRCLGGDMEPGPGVGMWPSFRCHQGRSWAL